MDALKEEVARHGQMGEPAEKLDVDGEFELTPELRAALNDPDGSPLPEFLELWQKPATRVAFGTPVGTYQLRESVLAAGLAQVFLGAWHAWAGNGSTVDGVATIVAGLFLAYSGVTKLNKVEVFILGLVCDAPGAKEKQKTLKDRFISLTKSKGGDREFIYNRAIDHLINLGVLAVDNPHIQLKDTVFGLPTGK
jgi:hypothetical protein